MLCQTSSIKRFSCNRHSKELCYQTRTKRKFQKILFSCLIYKFYFDFVKKNSSHQCNAKIFKIVIWDINHQDVKEVLNQIHPYFIVPNTQWAGEVLTLHISKMNQTPILGWAIGTIFKAQFCQIPSPPYIDSSKKQY